MVPLMMKIDSVVVWVAAVEQAVEYIEFVGYDSAHLVSVHMAQQGHTHP